MLTRNTQLCTNKKQSSCLGCTVHNPAEITFWKCKIDILDVGIQSRYSPLSNHAVISNDRERERVYFPHSNNTWTTTQQKYKIRRVARKALGPSELATRTHTQWRRQAYSLSIACSSVAVHHVTAVLNLKFWNVWKNIYENVFSKSHSRARQIKS